MSELTTSQAKALYAALVGDDELGVELEGGVHDMAPPEGTPYPYIILGTSTTIPIRTYNKDRYDHNTAIHIYSAKRGKAQILRIYEHLVRILNRARLPLEGAGELMIHGTVRLVNVLPEPDRNHYLGVVSYDCLLDG